jgi:Tfp pilus tip-associated adhesin PilY1
MTSITKPSFRPCAAILCLTLALFGASASAEDTDIFTVNKAITSERPNVLIMQDNSANWNSIFAAEKSALVSTVTGLDDRFNVGLMSFVETGGGNTNVDGSYIRAAVRRMTDTNKAALANLVNNFDILADKSNNAVYGLAMAEVYRYFGGLNATTGQVKRDAAGNTFNSGTSGPASQAVYALAGNAFTSMASNTYVSPIADNCAKNFVIVISNGPANDNASATSTATTALSGYGGNTASITLSPNGSQSNVADEWARFMANTDVNAAYPLTQNVVTYTVDVNPYVLNADGTDTSNGQWPGHTALLKSMALQGKGKYFRIYSGSTTAAADIAAALNQIFTEVIAKNSVFAASALPASVNTRGTFLNQVYMGQFRPDGQASPRWPGNMKQYKAGLNAANQLELKDSLGNPIADTTFGFLLGTIKSFWTTNSTFWNAAFYPDAQAPVNAQNLPIDGPNDNPDGNVVEKGGAAQRLRIAYAGPSPNQVSTRNVYTCTGACAAGSALSGYPFDTTNTAIDATALGINIVASVSSMSMVESTPGIGTVTATATAHGFTSGQSVTISGAAQPEYNGPKTVTVVNADTFTFLIAMSPATPATGTITLSKAAAAYSATATRAGTTTFTDTATITTSAAHGYVTGDTIAITGGTGSAVNYNKTVAVTVTGTNTFTYPITVDPPSPGNSSGTAGVESIKKITRSGNTVTVDTNGGNFTAGTSITLNGVPVADGGSFYNNTFTIATGGSKTFTFTATLRPPISVTGLSVAKTTAAPLAVSSITRLGSTATVTTTAAHGVTTGQSVTIAGATQTGYNGSFTATVVDSTHLTYPVVVTPTSPGGTATATLTGATSKDELIRWVRGENTKLDDNPSTAAAANTYVRGYLHGDVVHSRPATINYNRNGDDNDVVVFYGSNDGIFHATQGGQGTTGGNELWGFIAPEFFKKFTRLYSQQPLIDNNSASTAKSYFMDGPIATYTYDSNNDGKINAVTTPADKAYLYLSARRGGRFIYALDVSDPATPKLLWTVNSSTAGFGELGQTWGEGKIVKLKGYTNPVLVLTAGYDATANDAAPQTAASMGRGVFLIDAVTGAPIWHAGSAAVSPPPAGMVSVAVTGMDYSIPADAAVIDSDADGYVDRLYLADTGGNIWRANISAVTSGGAPDKAAWTVSLLAQLGGTGGNQRKFLSVPDVVAFDGPPATTDSILIGSGDREHPFDVSVTNRFYMIKDSHALTAVPPSVITETDLYDATSDAVQSTDSTVAAAATTALANAKGWYVTLGTGEKVVTSAITLAGSTVFGTNVPESTLSNANSCSSGLGEARIYTLNFKNAASVLDNAIPVGTLSAADRYSKVAGGGLPAPPVAISVEINGKFYEGVGMGPTIISPPGLPLASRKRVYWNMLSESK